MLRSFPFMKKFLGCKLVKVVSELLQATVPITLTVTKPICLLAPLCKYWNFKGKDKRGQIGKKEVKYEAREFQDKLPTNNCFWSMK